MRLGAFASRLDELFDIRHYAEPDGWDFALEPDDRAALLAHASPVFAETFNGLLRFGLDGERELFRVYCLVFPEESLVDYVIERERARGAAGALILTHHPVDMETSGRGFLAIPPRQLHELSEAGVAMYVLHASLDCHPEISTSGALADGLGLRRERTFAPCVGGDCGVIGIQEPEPFADFAERVQSLCELPELRVDQVRFSGRMVSRVAIVAGGGDDAGYIAEAEALGCDTYLAGHWWTPHQGDWCDQNRAAIRTAIGSSDMNLLSASHDGSELVVFRDRLKPLIERWGIEVELVRQADHWR
jgi:putative NIF3 family GTP cyclohydrolase 1 type 2